MHRRAEHPNGAVAVVASNRFPRARGGNRTGSVHTHHVVAHMIFRGPPPRVPRQVDTPQRPSPPKPIRDDPTV